MTTAFFNEHFSYHTDEALIQLTDRLMEHAIEQKISDIHIEPHREVTQIRFRRDGILYRVADLPKHLAQRVSTRLKVLAKLNITESRLPQDGRFHFQMASQWIDIRINTCPTLFGEKMVLRLLNVHKILMDIDHLGMTDAQKKLFLEKIRAPQGLILVTGPTGSGKTVTLYSALNYLNTVDKNISTVEDPIEIQLTGVNQVNVNFKIGLDFALVLKNFLRQDPDILMVGEIRDLKTADIAIQAAQTGHLVLSTLHTNHALQTLVRLQTMGVPDYQLFHSLSLIIAQRLVRTLCPHCKQPEKINLRDITLFGFTTLCDTTFYRAIGCDQCFQGYQGRTGIFELLPVHDGMMQNLLDSRHSLKPAYSFASLAESGLEKVRQGITSLTEIYRVIATQAEPLI